MSVVSVDQTVNHTESTGRTIELPAAIRTKLQSVLRDNRRAEVRRYVALFAAAGLLLLLVLIATDLLVGLSWAPVRWGIWIAAFGIGAWAIRMSVVNARQQKERLLDAAWKIESAHPDMEERLTSTVQFLEGDPSQLQASTQLIEALVDETSEGVSGIDADSIPQRSSWLRTSVAALLAGILGFSIAFWPQSVLTSLENLATPWSEYAVPTLMAKILPGDVAIAEGESLEIQVISQDVLVNPKLEIMRGEKLVTHSMTTSPEGPRFTLINLSESADYRVHSGGLYSLPHHIKVHPRPKLNGTSARLSFPAYTELEPLTVDQVVAPIRVPAGTEVTLVALSDATGVSGAIRWSESLDEAIATKVSGDSAADSVSFEWKLTVEPEMKLAGVLEVRSEHGVSSETQAIEIHSLPDATPGIELLAPSLRQLTLRRHSSLPIQYRVVDDFGVSRTELVLQYEEQEPVASSCEAPERIAFDQRVWEGATSVDLSQVPDECREVTLWLRVSDNRPDAYGGPQVIESERIRISLDDSADSVGEQQIQAQRQMIEQSLEQALEQMQAAKEAAEALQDTPAEAASEPNEQEGQGDHEARSEQSAQGEQDEIEDMFLSEEGKRRAREAAARQEDDAKSEPAPDEPSVSSLRENAREEHIDALRKQTQQAKETLDDLAEKLRDDSQLFGPKSDEIQDVADQEITEALEQANQIPLVDDWQQQKEHARAAKEELASAIEKLDSLKADLQQQAEQMEKAARLDELASKQERLADEAASGDPQDKPEEVWRGRQEEVAEDLKELAGNDQQEPTDQPLTPEQHKKLLQQADQAEQLAEQAQQLADQQRQLGDAVEKAAQDEATEEAKQQLQELIEEQKQQIDQQRQQAGQAKDEIAEEAKQAEEQKQQQRLDEAAKAAEEGEFDQAAAKLQEHIAERTEQVQQQAQEFAEQEHADEQAQRQAKKAAEELNQAKRKAEEAKQTSCEKCKGGGEGQSEESIQGDQDQPGERGESGAHSSQQTQPERQQQQGQQQQGQQQQQQQGQRQQSGQQRDQKGAPEQLGKTQSGEQQQENPMEAQAKNQQGAQSGKQGQQQRRTDDQQAGKQREQQHGQQQAEKLKREQQDASHSMQQAAQSLKQVCQSCRECANCNKPGSSSGSRPGSKSQNPKSGNSPKENSPSDAKQLAKAGEGAKQAAQAPSKKNAAQHAEEAAKELNELADKAAEESGYPLRKQKGASEEDGEQQGNDSEQGQDASGSKPSNNPQGVGKGGGDTNLDGQKLRGGSSSNWTRSRRKLGGGVLDDREGTVPEQYRGVVERYFEELSRQQSNRKGQ